MDWFEILKQMKVGSGMTTLEISEKSGVPEPTLEKLFSGFTKNPKLNTIIAVTHSFGRTLDDLAPLDETKKSPAQDESEVMDYNRTILMENYDGMNEAGKNELVKYSRLLVNSGEYKKCGEFGMGKGSA